LSVQLDAIGYLVSKYVAPVLSKLEKKIPKKNKKLESTVAETLKGANAKNINKII